MLSTYWRWLIFFFKIFLSPPMYSIRWRWLIFFSKIFLSPPMLSIRWRWLIFFSEIFLSPPYALHSLQVAMIFLNFGNFSKCWKSRFSQSLLFHSIPLPYVVNQIFPLYFVMGSFPPATAPNFQNFSKSYVLHLLTVANFFFQKFFQVPLCSPFVAGGYWWAYFSIFF